MRHTLNDYLNTYDADNLVILLFGTHSVVINMDEPGSFALLGIFGTTQFNFVFHNDDELVLRYA